jgi:fructose-1,6-bisphosphatase/inositol monophosphatase family enzyme
VIRARVVAACETSNAEDLSAVIADDEGDTIFAIDRISEDVVLEQFEREVASIAPIVLIAEGLSGGKVVLPSDANESEAVWRVIVDPIDGTRELMYQKRSAWILTGVAPDRGDDTTLRDVEFAIQTEIPIVKQHRSDTIWAFRDKGVRAERYDRLSGRTANLDLKPSKAKTIEQGFAMISRFFPGARDVLA